MSSIGTTCTVCVNSVITSMPMHKSASIFCLWQWWHHRRHTHHALWDTICFWEGTFVYFLVLFSHCQNKSNLRLGFNWLKLFGLFSFYFKLKLESVQCHSTLTEFILFYFIFFVLCALSFSSRNALPMYWRDT